LRTIRLAGVALLVLLTTAHLLRAAESTGSVQAISPAISTQTALPTAQPHGDKITTVPAEPRKAVARMVPVRSVSPATSAANPSTSPRLLHYEDFQRGLELIPVKKPGPVISTQPQGQSPPPKPTLPPQPPSPTKPASQSPVRSQVQSRPKSPSPSPPRKKTPSPATSVPPVPSTPHRLPESSAPVPAKVAEKPAIVRRLPPLDRIAPAASIPQHSRLPQEPIPLYPETGHD
jgi:hypothetical protein